MAQLSWELCALERPAEERRRAQTVGGNRVVKALVPAVAHAASAWLAFHFGQVTLGVNRKSGRGMEGNE